MKLTLVITGAQILSGAVTSLSKNLRSCDGHVFNKSQIAAVLSEQGVTVVDLTYTEVFDIQSVTEGDGGIYNVVLADGTTAIFQSTQNVKVVVSDEAAEEAAPEEAPEAAPAARGRAAAAPAQRGRASAPVATADDLEGLEDLDGGGELPDDGYDPDADPDFAEPEPAPAQRGRAAPAARGRAAAPAPQLDEEGFDDFIEEEPAPAPAPRGRAAAAPVAAARRPAAAAPVAPARRPAAPAQAAPARRPAAAAAPRGRSNADFDAF